MHRSTDGKREKRKRGQFCHPLASQLTPCHLSFFIHTHTFTPETTNTKQAAASSSSPVRVSAAAAAPPAKPAAAPKVGGYQPPPHCHIFPVLMSSVHATIAPSSTRRSSTQPHIHTFFIHTHSLYSPPPLSHTHSHKQNQQPIRWSSQRCKSPPSPSPRPLPPLPPHPNRRRSL